MVLVNGEQTGSLAVSDRGLLYGDGVWETIAVRAGKPQFLKEHLKRLSQGCKALNITAPDSNVLKSEIKQISASTNQSLQAHCVLKIIITRGTGSRGYRPDIDEHASPSRILSLHPWGEHIAKHQQQGIHLQRCKTRLAHNPQLTGFKHLNRLEQVLGSTELTPESQDGLMFDFTDNVIEGTMSNLFIITQDDQIKTPSLTNCGIKGIMRRKLMDWLNTSVQAKNNVTVETLNLNDVRNAKSLLMTNSIIGIWPVRTFEDKTYEIPDFVNTFNNTLETSN